MRLNKKGEGGFMEAMATLMVVTVALTSFIGLLVYIEIPGDNDIDINTDFLDSLKMENGTIVGDVRDDLAYIAEKNCISKIDLTVEIAGNISQCRFSDSYGDIITDDVISKYGTIEIVSDDGRTFIASFEVVCWI